MPGIVRLGDKSTSDPCTAPVRPNNQACAKTFVNGIAVHCVGHSWELHTCPKSPPHPATTSAGSSKSIAEGKPIARIGDPISCGSTCQEGSGNTSAN